MTKQKNIRGRLLSGCCMLAVVALSNMASGYEVSVASGTTETIATDISCLGSGCSASSDVTTFDVTGGGTLVLTGNNSFYVYGSTNDVSSNYNSIWVYDGSTLAIDSDDALGQLKGDTIYYNSSDYTDTTSGTTTLAGNYIDGGMTSTRSNYIMLGDGTTTGTLKFLADMTIDSTRQITMGLGNEVWDTGEYTVYVEGKLRGTGTIYKIGSGTLILGSTQSNFSGGVEVAEGTVQIGDATSGADDATDPDTTYTAWSWNTKANVAVDAGATLSFGSTNAAVTMSKIISGAGDVEVSSGTAIFTSSMTYTGETTIDAGATLQLGANSKTGTIDTSSGITDNGTLAFYRSDSTYTFAGLITGTGGVTQLSSTILVLTAANTYTGDTTVSNGTFQLGNSSYTTASVGGRIVNSSKVILYNDTTVGGGLYNYSGAKITIDDGVTIGNSTVDGVDTGVYNYGTINAADDVEFGGDVYNYNTFTISGSSTFDADVTNSGTFTLSDIVEILGDLTNDSAGTLTGTGFTVKGDVINSGTLSGSSFSILSELYNYGTFNDSGDLSSGSVTNTGTMTVSGTTTISGSLSNSGTLTLADATVTGNVTNSGTLSISNYVNTVTVEGDYTQTSTGELIVNVSSSGASELVVDGTAALDGTFDLTVNGVILESETYTVISASLISGTFDNSSGSSGGVTYSLSYTGTTVSVTITPNGLDYAASGDTLTLSDVISDSGDTVMNVIAYGGGTVVLTNTANTYTGSTIIASNSTLQIDDAKELGASQTLIIGDGTDTGTLLFAGSTTIGSSVSITLNAGDETIDTGDYTVTIASDFTGTGTLVKTGEGTLILASTNGYSNDILVSEGTLQIGDASDPDMTISSDVEVDTSLVYNFVGAITMTGAISGEGTMEIVDGTVIFTNADGYDLTTTVDEVGVLQFGNGSLSDFEIDGDITSSGSVIFNSQGTVTYGGDLSGSGSLTQSGSGILILAGDNTYTGVTYVTAGTLELTDGSLESQSIVISSGATLDFAPTDTYTYAGVISGAGNLEVTNGTAILTSTETYTGTTTVNNSVDGAILQIGDGGTTGWIDGDIVVTNEDDVVAFDRSDDITYGYSVSGLGTLEQMGSGTLTLTNTSTVSQVQVAAGTLAIGSGGSFVSGTTTITLYSTVDGVLTGTSTVVDKSTTTVEVDAGAVFDISGADGDVTIQALISEDDYDENEDGTVEGSVILGDNNLIISSGSGEFAGVISGTGGVIIYSGTLTLTGDNTYTGDTTIYGTLKLGSSTAGGSISSSYIYNYGSINMNATGEVTIDGVISGTGSLTISKAGTLILESYNTYTGTTTVSAGTLQFGDDDNLYTAIGGSLVSTGEGLTTTVLVGGAGGVAYVGGSYSLGSESTTDGTVSVLALTIGATDDGEANVAQLDVAGTVTIAGDTELSAVVESGTYAKGGIYTVLKASSISGTFTTSSGASNGIAYAAIYPDDTEVDLIVTPMATAQIYSDMVTANVNTVRSMNDIVMDEASFDDCASSDKSKKCTGWNTWTQAFGGFGHMNGGDGANAYNTRSEGVLVGGSYRFSRAAGLNAAAGFSHGKVAVGGDNGGISSTNSMYLAVGGHISGDRIAFDGNVFYGINFSDVSRHASDYTTWAGVNSTYTGYTFQFSYPLFKNSLVPFARISYMRMIHGPITEAGGGYFGLMGQKGGYVNGVYDVGVRYNQTYMLDDGITLQPHVLVALEECGDLNTSQAPAIEMGLIYGGTYDFEAPTPVQDRLAGVVRLGLNAKLDDAWTVNVDLNGRYSGIQQQTQLSFGAAYHF